MGATFPSNGQSSATPIPKNQLLRVLNKARKLMMRKMLLAKRQNIRERIQFYKVDVEKYREAAMKFMANQPNIMKETMQQACLEQGVQLASFGMSLQMNMMDPDIQSRMVGFQTMTGDMCENQAVPQDVDIERFKEFLRIQITELEQFTITDPPSSMLGQLAASDQIYQRFGIDEIQLGALAIKFEEARDPEVLELKERYNTISKMEMFMNPQGPHAGHSHK